MSSVRVCSSLQQQAASLIYVYLPTYLPRYISQNKPVSNDCFFCTITDWLSRRVRHLCLHCWGEFELILLHVAVAVVPQRRPKGGR